MAFPPASANVAQRRCVLAAESLSAMQAMLTNRDHNSAQDRIFPRSSEPIEANITTAALLCHVKCVVRKLLSHADIGSEETGVIMDTSSLARGYNAESQSNHKYLPYRRTINFICACAPEAAGSTETTGWLTAQMYFASGQVLYVPFRQADYWQRPWYAPD